jgi:endoglucanase
MSPAAIAAGATFEVTNTECATVLTAAIGSDLGSWSPAFPHVYDLDLSSVSSSGQYTVKLSTGAIAATATITIGSGQALYAPLLSNALFFYQAQEDGPNVHTNVFSRQPSHLADEKATVYSPASYSTDGNDTLLKKPTPVAGMGTVDVSGGWFDAGDYLKFVETSSYVVAVMLVSVRDFPNAVGAGTSADFYDEAAFGISWLRKMWNDRTQTLLHQVGLGNGNTKLNINGDHDVPFRLPQVDDTYGARPGDPNYYVQYRPAFLSGPAGSKISPNLAGRLAADFGLCSQVYRASNSALADECLVAGEHVWALANTTPPAQLLTTTPFDYYGETSWQEDLELGAAELYFALAGAGALPAGLPQTNPAYYLGQAATWAHAYVTSPSDGTDSLNLYDVSGLAHYELHRAMTHAGTPANLAITQAALLSDLKKQLQIATTQAKSDPFQLGVVYGPKGPDLTPHALGLALTADFYRELSGDAGFSTFAEQQKSFVLGANAWGSSFIVGAGKVFPVCPQAQVPNLIGSLDGTPPVLLGAAVDGPTDPANLVGLLVGGPPTGARACPASGVDSFAKFNGHKAAYQDDVADWPTVEPADDYTVLSVLLFARQ